eukprot:TRINITY_DN3286_c0_g2_i1.p1 TRINITY_DN3286_c0_g2~~TRINITY_DN3286_c0_g2_i1.p1  ORF type:complete len:277 (+),score=54.39 TRINITY_DN3286_c0_g2_i1:103-933(+)
MFLTDRKFKRKVFGGIGQQGRFGKVKVSMARLLTVVNERKKVREEYRRHLEEEYLEKKRAEYMKQLRADEEAKNNQVRVPQITAELLRAKYRDLKRSVDNLDYIKEAVEGEIRKEVLKKDLDERFDYKKKRVVAADEQVPAAEEGNVIRKFESGIEEQLRTGRLKISQEEVLRSHVRNWRMLNLRQKRILLGFINARRAKDAREEFLKELDLLGQKIAYDNAQAKKPAKLQNLKSETTRFQQCDSVLRRYMRRRYVSTIQNIALMLFTIFVGVQIV